MIMGLIDELNERKKKQATTANTSSSGGLMAELYMRQKYDSLPTDSVNAEYVNSFISEANDFLGSDADDSSYSRWKELTAKADIINAWLYKNKSNIGSENFNNISSVINSFGTATKNFAQFETEDAYLRELMGWLN